MKNKIFSVIGAVVMLAGFTFSANAFDCFGVINPDGGNIIYCDNATYVYSTYTPIGGCAGANTDCQLELPPIFD